MKELKRVRLNEILNDQSTVEEISTVIILGNRNKIVGELLWEDLIICHLVIWHYN